MALSTSNLANFINEKMMKRMATNLRMGFFKGITLEFTRTELRTGHTKGDRIKDVSIEKMITELRDYGYVVKGKPGSENFKISFDVETYLSQADTLAELIDGTDFIDELLSEE